MASIGMELSHDNCGELFNLLRVSLKLKMHKSCSSAWLSRGCFWDCWLTAAAAATGTSLFIGVVRLWCLFFFNWRLLRRGVTWLKWNRNCYVATNRDRYDIELTKKSDYVINVHKKNWACNPIDWWRNQHRRHHHTQTHDTRRTFAWGQVRLANFRHFYWTF